MAYLGPSPIPVNRGGTGAVTLTGVLTGVGTSAITAQTVTQYNPLVGGASNAISSISAGTVGQGLFSNGAAANPSYQNSGGALFLLSTQTAVSVTSINFVSMITSAFKCYMLRWYFGAPGTDNGALQLRFSNNNGSSFNTSSYLGGDITNAYTTGTLSNSNITGAIRINNSQDVDANIRSAGDIFIMNCQASVYCSSVGHPVNGTTSSILFGRSVGTHTTLQNVNAIQVVSSGGGILSGTFSLYGLKES